MAAARLAGRPPPNPGDTNGISLLGSPPPKRHHRPCMRDQRNRANTKLDKILEITFYSIFFPKVWNSERNVIFAMYFFANSLDPQLVIFSPLDKTCFAHHFFCLFLFLGFICGIVPGDILTLLRSVPDRSS